MINYTMVFSNINIMVFCLHSLPPPIDSGCALSVQPTGFALIARTGSEWAVKGDLPECWAERWRMAVLSVGVKKEWEGQGTLPVYGTSLAPCLWRSAISSGRKKPWCVAFAIFMLTTGDSRLRPCCHGQELGNHRYNTRPRMEPGSSSTQYEVLRTVSYNFYTGLSAVFIFSVESI